MVNPANKRKLEVIAEGASCKLASVRGFEVTHHVNVSSVSLTAKAQYHWRALAVDMLQAHLQTMCEPREKLTAAFRRW